MATQVTVALGADRRPVALKRATSPSGTVRLRHEAAVLDAARHPGVVAVVDVEPGEDDGGACLRTLWVPGGSLAAPRSARRAVRTLAKILATASATVADLHERGIVHGRLTADHVLVDEHDNAVLTGFAGASQHGDRPSADDVAALGRLVTAAASVAVTRSAGLAGLLPGRARREREQAEQLADIGRRASDPLPSRRPSARALARQLGELAPATPPDGATIGQGRRWPARPVVLFGSVVVVASAVVAIGLRWPRDPVGRAGPSPDSSGTAPDSAPGSPASATGSGESPGQQAESDAMAPTSEGRPASAGGPRPSAAGVLVAAQPTAPPVPPATGDPCPALGPDAVAVAPDADGDGCPESVTIRTGTGTGTVTVGGHTYSIDLAVADRVLIGDWDCDGIATLAVVHLPSGAVDLFDRWPAADATVPIAATRTSAVAGAASAEVVPAGDGQCARIAVRTTTGTVLVGARPGP